MIPTHKNSKSGAEVTYLSEYAGKVEFREGAKLRRTPVEKFLRDYVRLNDDEPITLTMPQIARPPNYGPRKVDEVALARQRLQVRGSRRKELTKDDRSEMAKVGSVLYCCGCGVATNLQVSHAPSGIFGHGGSIKGHPALLARLCEPCHISIDQHKRPDWLEAWLIAYARTQAYVYDMRSVA